MGNALGGGIYVVATTKDGKTEYWAAATVRAEAVAAVRRQLTGEWTVTLTERRLTSQKIRALKLGPNAVCRLREAK
jgi:hypothetical protein